MKNKFPSIVYNPITITGAAVSAISFGIFLFLTILEFFSAVGHSVYVGIFTFIILPSILIAGIFLIIFGIIREKRRVLSGKERERVFWVIDLNDSKQRMLFTTFTAGTIIFLFFSAFGSYKAYEYTETDEFCGTVCHSVMEPEYAAYLNSPHSKVGCIKCHIGGGTDWYVKSKLSGAYQVYSVLFNKYSKPIPTPVKELRPAEGTCEQCHSPEHFFSEKKTDYTYYLSDKNNTRSDLSMLIKVGGGNLEFGTASGIHWHMNIYNKVYYIHTDERRQEIPWVKMITGDGKEVIFRDKRINFDENNFPKENYRQMDCIDCHNRPSHIFHQPDKMVNLYMKQGRIDETIPYIKNISVQALETKYSEKGIALDSINTIIRNFYRSNFRDVYEAKKENIYSGIKEVQKIYERNYFPFMNANWKSFPDNIAHTYTPGCFRCHDGNHVSDDGKVITRDCNSCHTILSQTDNTGLVRTNINGLDFIHPTDIGSDIDNMSCVDCHGGK